MSGKRIVALAHYSFEKAQAGGESYLHELLKALAGAGHDVTAVITSNGVGPRSVLDCVKYVYVGRLEYRHMTYPRPQLIISHFQHTKDAIRYSRMLRVPMMTIIHNDRPETLRMAAINRPNDLVVCNTNWIAKAVRTRCRKVVVHPPVDRARIYTKQHGEHITLVNLTPPKGVDTFYALAKRMPDKKFLGVGGGYWKNTQVFEELPNVTFMPNQPDMKQVYGKSRIVLMPSDYETYGLVAREAIINGLPVIVHPTTGLRENLEFSGIYLDRNDIEAWEKEIRDLDDPDYYELRSGMALERAGEDMTEVEIAEFLKAIDSVR